MHWPRRKILRLRLGRCVGAQKRDCQCGIRPKSLANGHAFLPFVSGRRPPELQQIAGRLPAGHALAAQETKELGAVAPARRAPYIPGTFQSSMMTLSGFARTGGRSAEEIYQWRPRP